MSKLIVNEHTSDKYPPRTYYNAKSSDVTLALAVDLTTAGEKLTHKAAGEKYIGFKLEDSLSVLDVARPLYRKLKHVNAKSLNVAGNGIYTLIKANCNQEFINQYVYWIIKQVHEHYPLEKIYTGGQTGVDIAGAVAGHALGIETEVTLPKGYIQRFEDNKDVIQTKEQVTEQILDWVNKLNLNSWDYEPGKKLKA